MPTILLHSLPASLYAALFVACLHPTPWRKRLAPVLLLLALAFHGLALGETLFDGGRVQFGLSIALSLTLWLAMLIYGLQSLLVPLHELLRLAAPVAAVCSLLPGLVSGHPQILASVNWAFKAHIVVAMLAYSLFTLAVFHALVLMMTERRLHEARLTPVGEAPPLLVLDGLLFSLITAAFVFLTLTVGSGLLFSESIFGKPFSFNHKAAFGIASWSLFAILLAGHKLAGWRGKTARRWLLAGFSALLMAYAGTRFVLELILQRNI